MTDSFQLLRLDHERIESRLRDARANTNHLAEQALIMQKLLESHLNNYYSPDLSSGQPTKQPHSFFVTASKSIHSHTTATDNKASAQTQIERDRVLLQKASDTLRRVLIGH